MYLIFICILSYVYIYPPTYLPTYLRTCTCTCTSSTCTCTCTSSTRTCACTSSTCTCTCTCTCTGPGPGPRARARALGPRAAAPPRHPHPRNRVQQRSPTTGFLSYQSQNPTGIRVFIENTCVFFLRGQSAKGKCQGLARRAPMDLGQGAPRAARLDTTPKATLDSIDFCKRVY